MDALGLNDDQRLRVEVAMTRAAGHPPFRYPWDALEAQLAERGAHSLPMIGYGSLLNRESSARTLGADSLRTARPVVCFGARRVFDYEMPLDLPRTPRPATPDARAALNVHLTGDGDDVLNGLLFDMARDDVQAMREREVGYDLLPVACMTWDAAFLRVWRDTTYMGDGTTPVTAWESRHCPDPGRQPSGRSRP